MVLLGLALPGSASNGELVEDALWRTLGDPLVVSLMDESIQTEDDLWRALLAKQEPNSTKCPDKLQAQLSSLPIPGDIRARATICEIVDVF